MKNCTKPSVLDEILERKTMKVAVGYTKPPEDGLSEEFYIDTKTGKPAGVVIDYMELMCKDLGVKPEFINMPWKDQLDALLNGVVDILPKPSNTPDRALKLDFAGRLIKFDVVIVMSINNKQTIDQLAEKGKKIAVIRGSSNRQIVEERFPQSEIVEIDEYLQGADLLENGSIDAWVESPVAKNLFDVRPTITVMRDEEGKLIILSSEYAHPAIRQGDERFLNWINNWISYRRAKGELDYLTEVKWLKTLVE